MAAASFFFAFKIFFFGALCCGKKGVFAWAPTQCGPGNLMTQWGAQVDPNSVLPEYPRPQMVRPDSTWQNLNGVWEFQPGSAGQQPPFGQTLSGEILVPFPVESCLSGVGQNHQYLWYRLVFNTTLSDSHYLLHFGAVDWQTTVWLNEKLLGNHTGGYDGFTFDISSSLSATNNELIVFVYDPSDLGFQPNGKQRISAITNPGGDTYTPSSGIWQTVWVEAVPDNYISNLKILADLESVSINVSSSQPGSTFSVNVFSGEDIVAKGEGVTGTPISIIISDAILWNPGNPFLYNLTVSIAGGDSVDSYFGMRTFTLGNYTTPSIPPTGVQVGIDRPGEDLPGYPVTLFSADPNLCWAMCNQTAECTAWAYGVPNCGGGSSSPLCWLKNGHPGTSSNQCRDSGDQGTPGAPGRRPLLNGEFTFLAGWLDQSFWPDGLYTAPTDEALEFDLLSVKTFGLNMVRLHQKVNSERWYYHADRLGIIIYQDMIQKYGGATQETVAPFTLDLEAMIAGRYNHPCIVQWEVFNEGDCVAQFDAAAFVALVQSLDPSRLVDTDSGGPANSLYVGNVNDLHTYPYPGFPIPSATQYAMLGEFGGIGAFVSGHEWVPNQCQTYLQEPTPDAEAQTYISMAQTILSRKDFISATVYTQITDVERECDGFMNYDRTNKFSADDTQAIAQANQNLIKG